ncbi:unnamed protein product [Triticum turgidum subsp. durum]|uniref:Remorin C-terminal domain-containing protein n=1 Tax=Triticum turgidum subsp. durum TaxID=4567 RepID=A0A9R1PTT9_TRITD|nr:unnamed protein product [Triticum turgidum subsp. durum]
MLVICVVLLPRHWDMSTPSNSDNNKNTYSATANRYHERSYYVILKKMKNLATKKVSAILSWENTKKANIEAQLKKIEEQLEKKKAEYAEKMKNKAAMIHKEAEEKRAMVEAKKGEELLKAEEMAAKYRATGHSPKKVMGCFGA